MGQIKEIAAGDEDITMVDDFEYLTAMARENPAPLRAVNFNFSLIHDTEFLQAKLSEVRAAAAGESTPAVAAGYRLRTAAYTHLREGVDTIRACGQFVFARDAKRLRGYLQDNFGELYDALEDKGATYGDDRCKERYASSPAASRSRAAS